MKPIYSPSAYQSVLLQSGYSAPTSSLSIDVYLKNDFFDSSGAGVLSGVFPDSSTVLDGVPVSASVRVSIRDVGALLDGLVVGEVQSNQDGSWLIGNLNPYLKYDVCGRLPNSCDVIVSDVSPVSE